MKDQSQAGSERGGKMTSKPARRERRRVWPPLRFEHHTDPLLPRADFIRRVLASTGIAIGILLVSLVGGMIGYHHFEGLGWLDAFLSAVMILGGMGPVAPLVTSGGKLFAGIYALYSGFVILAAASLALGPVFHRIIHRFHLDSEEPHELE